MWSEVCFSCASFTAVISTCPLFSQSPALPIEMAEAQDGREDSRPHQDDTITSSGSNVRVPAPAGDTTPTQSSAPTTSLSPPSDMEVKLYYYVLPSRPTLVARTGTTPWKVPTDPEATLVAKDLRPLGNHPLRFDTHTDNIFVKILALLDSLEVQWTSIDPLRIGEEGAVTPPLSSGLG